MWWSHWKAHCICWEQRKFAEYGRHEATQIGSFKPKVLSCSWVAVINILTFGINKKEYSGWIWCQDIWSHRIKNSCMSHLQICALRPLTILCNSLKLLPANFFSDQSVKCHINLLYCCDLLENSCTLATTMFLSWGRNQRFFSIFPVNYCSGGFCYAHAEYSLHVKKNGSACTECFSLGSHHSRYSITCKMLSSRTHVLTIYRRIARVFLLGLSS